MPTPPVKNVLYLADSYKVSHYKQYPPGTTKVYAYFEPRGGEFDRICFFGLQYILKQWLVGQVVSEDMIDEAARFYEKHFRGLDIFNADGWRGIIKRHGGRIPLRIKAVPEGAVVPYKNVLFTVENTDPEAPWLTTWFETVLVQVWYPMTVCTISRIQKLIIARYLRETSGSVDPDALGVKLHDFGYRGVSSVETAAIGGAAHMVNFVGTDTIAGLRMLRDFYAADMAGFSIPAAEHSTVTLWGKEGENEAFKNMLDQFSGCFMSCVSDSYDLMHAVSNLWGKNLKVDVLRNGEKGGCLVVRPDSGDPTKTVAEVLNRLEAAFGSTKNSLGYKVLPNCLRVIQGDGISYQTVGKILESLKKNGWSAENLIFGTGGALLQKLHRDTFQCAFKASYAEVNGKGRHVFKDPCTDRKKKSKKGLLTLERDANGEIVTVQEGKGDPEKDLLELVFENGELKREYSLEEIRKRARIHDYEIDAVEELLQKFLKM